MRRIDPCAHRILILGVLATLLAVRPLASATHPTRHGPLSVTIEGRIPSKLRFKLVSAYSLAQKRLETDLSCRRLFEPFAPDARLALARGSFRLASSKAELAVCSRRSAAAFTTVGGATTHLCPRLFAGLTVQKAAALLIHEALHQVGMTEWPMDPAAMSSTEINTLVRNRCGL